MRGHTEENSNFMAIVRVRAETDKTLNHHLENAHPKARYLSPLIQNELLEICASQIRDKIVENCNTAPCFSLLADETTDTAVMEQLAIAVRYIKQEANGYSLREDFLGFVHAKSLKGQDLAQLLLESLQTWGIEIQRMRGQGYDGAANMSGRHNGVQAVIASQIPGAVYVHCQAHCLNLALVHASKEAIAKNIMSTVQEIAFAFKYSAKRMLALRESLDANQDVLRERKKLVELCETRWAARALALTTFRKAFAIIVEALTDLEEDGDSKARQLRCSILKFDFIVGLVSLEALLLYSVPLSDILQRADLCLIQAADEAETLLNILNNMREDVRWNELYQEACDLAATFDIPPTAPRVAGRQMLRMNVPAPDSNTYWKRNLYLPFLDHLINEITVRVLNPKPRMLAQYLLPRQLHQLNSGMEAVVFQSFNNETADHIKDLRATEIQRWRAKWEGYEQHEKPGGLLQTLDVTDQHLYPNIFMALSTLVTMPVSTASVERSFSSLRRIKTWLRSTMTEDRLTSLALLHVHRDHEVDVVKAVNAFAAKKPRNLELVFKP